MRLINLVWVSIFFILTIGHNGSASTVDSDYFSTPLKNSQILNQPDFSPVTPNRLYGLEERLMNTFEQTRQQVMFEMNLSHETRDSLRISFERFSEDPEFQANYMKKNVRNHTFFVPVAMLKAADTPQKKRLKSGKAFLSPAGKKPNQGHHVDQEDAIDAENPALVWVLTRTSHQGMHTVLHLPAHIAGHSHISRGKFRYAQQMLYKDIYRLLSESPEELVSLNQTKKRLLDENTDGQVSL